MHTIPFGDACIIYRPLRPLAFVGNAAMARYVESRARGEDSPDNAEADEFLDALGFWEPDPAPPAAKPAIHPHRPTMAVLLMTSACNLRCTYCYARGGETSTLKMSRDLARKTLDAACANARALGRKRWSLVFHGPGEPTTNWDVLADSVEYARGQGLKCHISMSTNGVLSPARRAFIIEHFNGVSVSFDGIREVQDGQRPRAGGSGSFDAVAETMREFDAARFRYGVRMTATPAHFHRLPESVAWLCANTRCRSIQIEPAYCTERGHYQDPSPEQAECFVRAFMDAFEVAVAAGRELSYSGARPWLLTDSFCRAPQHALVVTPEGDLVTCFETHDHRHPLMDQFTIGRIGYSGVEIDEERLAAFYAKQEGLREECRGCYCYWHCGGDCSVKRLSYEAPRRGRCEVNRAVTRELLAWYVAASDGIWRGSAGPRPRRAPSPPRRADSQPGN